MATILDFTKFAFTAEQVRAVKELVFDEVISAPDIDLFHTVYPGIVFDKEIGFVGKGGLLGVAAQGCNPTPQTYNIGTRMVKWTPKGWSFYIQQCASELESTAALYSLKTGVDFFDFEGTDYMAIVVEVLSQSVKEFIIRLVWFSDTLIDNFSESGTLKNGVSKTYFNILDGFFKQMLTQVTAIPAQKITITENAGASYAAQALVPANVRDTYLPGLIYKANPILRGQATGFILCTQSFYDAYEQSLAGVSLESMYANLVNGQKTLKYKSVPLIPVLLWDSIIAEYFDNGTKRINPHRAVYITKDILAIGVDDTSSFGEMNIYYDQKTEYVDIKGRGKADAKLLNPALFQLAI